jgi:hypothetical protein
LQDAGGQLGLAEAVLAVQVLADQVAERVAHADALRLNDRLGCLQKLRKHFSHLAQIVESVLQDVVDDGSIDHEILMDKDVAELP